MKQPGGIVFALIGICLFLTDIIARAEGNAQPYEPREGDIAFQSLPHNPLVDAIEGVTSSSFSHCGIVHWDGPNWVVIEAIGPVKETPLRAWILQGRASLYCVYRLKPTYNAIIRDFVKIAQSYEGLPYDIHYDLKNEGAFYCSGLIYKAFQKATKEDLGKLQKLGDLNWKPYTGIIKQIESGNLPLEREIITPRGISEAPQLDRVYATGIYGSPFQKR